MKQEPEFSVLQACQPRPLAVALAHVLMGAPDHDPRRQSLTRLYGGLSQVQRAQCQAELVRCWQRSFRRDVKAARAA